MQASRKLSPRTARDSSPCLLYTSVVKALQSVTSLPLQLDSSNVKALENGLRVYNGKPIVNSTNGEQEKLDADVYKRQLLRWPLPPHWC